MLPDAATCRASQGARGLKLAQRGPYALLNRSRLARGAWIETGFANNTGLEGDGRASQGARGLKHQPGRLQRLAHQSRLARGAWIETANKSASLPPTASRASQGARGLKPGPWWIFV